MLRLGEMNIRLEVATTCDTAFVTTNDVESNNCETLSTFKIILVYAINEDCAATLMLTVHRMRVVVVGLLWSVVYWTWTDLCNTQDTRSAKPRSDRDYRWSKAYPSTYLLRLRLPVHVPTGSRSRFPLYSRQNSEDTDELIKL
jgi:predicted transglutaminase-like protease